MRKVLYIFIFASLFILTSVGIKNKPSGLTYELAFTIKPSAGSSVASFAIVGVDTVNNKIVNVEMIREANFVLFCKGIYRCKANPKQINYFEKHEIDCGLMLDDPIMRKGFLTQDTMWDEMKPLCLPIYDLWKLRYAVHPHYGKNTSTIPEEDKGWAATRYYPSYHQVRKLQEYGVINVTDFFYGENMFKLFKDIQDEDWIETYKGLLD